VQVHMYDIQGRTRENRLRRFLADLGRDRARDLITLRRCDVLGSRPCPKKDEGARMEALLETMCADGTPFTLGELDIDGAILCRDLQRPQGKWTGAVLQQLRLWCIEHPQKNQREYLLRRAQRLVEQIDHDAAAPNAAGKGR